MPNILLQTKLNQPSVEQLSLPYYPLLPKDKIGLLKWRIYARERALVDLEFRNELEQMCKADIAFMAATFVYLHETRNIEGQSLGKFPMLPDADQVDILAWFAKYGGSTDITVSKTRGIGLSYLAMIYALWIWKWHGEQIEIACLSKDEQSLDMKDRPSSLIGKLDLLFNELPAWMRVDANGSPILDRALTKHRFRNASNGNVIGGFVASDDKVRSGRYYIIILDEAAFFPADIQRWVASAHGASNSIVWLSTFDGCSNLFYRLSTNDDPNVNMVRIDTYWWSNPRWAAGRYVSKNGQIEILDKSYKFPADYRFSHDDPGLERSPLVDSAFNRPGADKQKVKEELFGLAVKDSRKLFSSPRTLQVFKESEKRPLWRGDYVDGEWAEDETGPIKLWVLPHSFNGVYVAGGDPSLGAMAGAKAGLAVIDIKTGLYVLTARFEGLDGIAFAQKAVAICKALCGPRGAGYCTLAWESTGIGGAFTAEVARLRYPAVWYELGKSSPGCHNSDRGESWLLELGRALTEKNAILMCGDAFFELRAWEYDRLFNLIFASTDGHGDLGIGAAIAWRAAAMKRKSIIDSQKKATQHAGIEINEYAQRQKKKTYSDMFESKRRR